MKSENIDKVTSKGFDDKKLSELFEKLDKNKDGSITIDELKEALSSNAYTKDLDNEVINLMKSTDKNTDNKLSFEEFLDFVQSREMHLKLAFKQMDRNNDNKISAEEIKITMKELGVNIDLKEAEELLSRMDKDNNLNIDYDEWRNFLLLSNTKDMKDIIQYWRKSFSIDLGENMTIPDDFSAEEKKTGVAWKTLVAGGVAGCVSRTATAPLDRLKITMQAHGAKAANYGIINALKYMIKEGGVSSLWRGNGVNCIKIAPESAIKFLAYESFKKIVVRISHNDTGEVKLIEKFISGALAGATSQTLIYPMEVLKTRMCLRKSGQYSSIFDCARKVYRAEGVSVFFRGYVPNILGIIPYAGIDLALYETFKNTYLKSLNQDKNVAAPIYVSLSAGAISSVCGQVATYPLALIRTKLQAMSKVDSKDHTMMSIMKNISKTEGPLGFYRGIGPNMLKVIPAVSISYAVFDQTRHFLRI